MKRALSVFMGLVLVLGCLSFSVSASSVKIDSVTFASATADVVKTAPQGGSTVSALIDGDTVSSATAFSTKGIILIQNTHCTTSSEFPEFSFTLALNAATDVDGLSLSFYKEYNSMIGLPKDNKIKIETSTDGTTYSLAATATFDGQAEAGLNTVQTAELTFDAVNASYVRVTMAYGTSPFTDKPVWEWIGLTEIAVTSSGATPTEKAENLALKKTYTTKGIYMDNTGNVLYPDEGSVTLTDGLFGDTAGFGDPAFVGFNIGGVGNTEDDPISNIIVDLGSVADLSEFVLTALDNKGEAGIAAPKSILVSVSDDNSTWTEVGTAEEDITPDAAAIVTYTLTESASGRYVKFEITHGSNWAFVSEVEVFAAENEEEITALTPTASSKIKIDGSYLLNVASDMTVDTFKKEFKNPADKITVSGTKIATGVKVTCDGKEYTIIVKGDVTQDGTINARDYILVRQYLLGSATLNDAQTKAASFPTAQPNASTYRLIRSYLLGGEGILE